MKRYLLRIASVASLGLVVALFSACGGGGSDGVTVPGTTTTTIAGTTTTTIAGVTTTTVAGGTTTTTVGGTTTTTTTLPGTPGVYSGKTTPATVASVMTGVSGSSDFLPICSAASTAPKLVVDNAIIQMLQIASAKQVAKSTYLELPGIPSSSYNSYATPQAGSCGGTIQIPANSFSHLNGTTRGTFVYSNYCDYVSGTSGPVEIIDGSVQYVVNGSNATGSVVVSNYTAEIPTKLTITEKSAVGGTVTSTNTIVANGFKLTLPAAGATTSTYTIDLTNLVATENTKTTKITGLKVTAAISTTGATEESITARLYISEAGYVDISTPTPIKTDADGKFTAGVIKLTGSDTSVNLTIDTTAANGPVFTIPGSSKKLDCSSAL